MAFTTGDVLTKVRQIVKDDIEPYRWEDVELRGHLQLAVKRLNVRVPTTRYVGDEMVDFIELPESDDEALSIADIHEEALVCYVLYLCYSKDDPDTSNAELSNAYLAKAERLMV